MIELRETVKDVPWKPGDTFDIKVGPFKTTLTADEHNVLRLPINTMYDWLMNNIASSVPGDPRYGGLNALAVAHAEGKFTREEYLEYYLNIGYSIDGFLELHNFWDYEIVMPPVLADIYLQEEEESASPPE